MKGTGRNTGQESPSTPPDSAAIGGVGRRGSVDRTERRVRGQACLVSFFLKTCFQVGEVGSTVHSGEDEGRLTCRGKVNKVVNRREGMGWDGRQISGKFGRERGREREGRSRLLLLDLAVLVFFFFFFKLTALLKRLLFFPHPFFNTNRSELLPLIRPGVAVPTSKQKREKAEKQEKEKKKHGISARARAREGLASGMA